MNFMLRTYLEAHILLIECNFKSKIRHRDKPGCNLTPTHIICPGEENCVLYLAYKNNVKKTKKPKKK